MRSSPVAAVALAIISSTFGSAMPDCRPSLAILEEHREHRVAAAVVVLDGEHLRRPALLVGLAVELLLLRDLDHLHLDGEADVLQHLLHRLDHLDDAGEQVRPADQVERGVDRHAVGLRLLEQRRRLLGVVGVLLHVRVPAERRRRHHRDRADHALGQQRADEGVAVDRHVQRLAHPLVADRVDGAVEPEVERLGVQVGDVGLGVGRVDRRDRRREVGLALRHHRRGDGRVGAEHVGRLRRPPGPRPSSRRAARA